MSKFKKFRRISFLAINGLVIAFLLLACLVPFLKAGKNAFIALLGLGFPMLFITVLFFFIYWLVRKSKWAWVCMAALLLSWQQVKVMFSFGFEKKFEVSKSPNSLRVLTWNLSSWGTRGRNNVDNESYRSQMIDVIKNADADVLCFQEFHFEKGVNYKDSLLPELKAQGFTYGYFVQSLYTMHLFKSAHVTGVAILSKFPIIDTAHFIYSNNDFAEPLIYADIKKYNKITRVYTTHLQSVRFEDYDYQALHKLKEPGKANIIQSRAVAWKLKQAYIKRSSQADLIQQKIIASPYPIIFCGDFNDVPNSYTYFTIKGNLQDAFLKKGSGFGRTFRFISPTLRIDYLLADKKFKVTQYHKFEVKYSDHYPVMGDFGLDGD